MDLYRAAREATDRQPRLLGVFAHPDDEVFCAGGTLAQWAAAGGETMVISATRGEAGQIHDASAATRRTLGAVREQELRAACGQLGVRRVECMDYRDGTLAEVDEATLAGEVAARIRAFDPDVVITFGSDGGYGHPDHIAISAATVRACQQIAYTEGRAPRLYFSAFPRHHRLLCRQLAHWLAQRGSAFHGSDTFTRALALLADEATMMGYADDTVEVRWYPAGIAILEQGETGNGLYLVVSGHADVIEEDSSGSRRVCRHVGPGQFFGDEALVQQQAQQASVVATETVTCLVLSTHAPTLYEGRGADTPLGGVALTVYGDGDNGGDNEQAHSGSAAPLLYVASCAASGLTVMDVSAWLDDKIAALAAHRTQFVLEPNTFPCTLLEDWLGREYFARVALPTAVGDTYASATHRADLESSWWQPDTRLAVLQTA